jgi:hypothetical protein
MNQPVLRRVVVYAPSGPGLDSLGNPDLSGRRRWCGGLDCPLVCVDDW